MVSSPVVLDAYDSLGRHTGPLTDSAWEEAIPGSEYIPGDLTGSHSKKGILLPPDQKYRFVVSAIGETGYFRLSVVDIVEGEAQHTSVFDQVRVLPSSVAECSLQAVEAGLTLHMTNPGTAIPDTTYSVTQFISTALGSGPDFNPKRLELAQNYPNPFNPTTTISYGVPHRTHVILTVYNTLGQKVAELVNGEEEAGYHDLKFDGSNLASGVYFYRLQAGSFVETKKLLLLR